MRSVLLGIAGAIVGGVLGVGAAVIGYLSTMKSGIHSSDGIAEMFMIFLLGGGFLFIGVGVGAVVGAIGCCRKGLLLGTGAGWLLGLCVVLGLGDWGMDRIQSMDDAFNLDLGWLASTVLGAVVGGLVGRRSEVKRG